MRDYETGPEGYHIGAVSPSFVSNSRRLLQVKSCKHYVHGFKEGKVSMSRLYRVALPPIDNGDWNARFFKKRTAETDLLNTAISMQVDWSGSMAGTKARTAAKAAGHINEAFSKVLHIPLEITAFSSRGAIPVVGMIKSFDQHVTSDQVANRFYEFLAHMSGNNDSDVVLWAYHRLLARKEKRKILIVLSDGSPADGIGDPYHSLRMVTDQIVREKHVDLYGIGIEDDNVTHFYPNNTVVWDIEELEAKLIEVMGKALT